MGGNIQLSKICLDTAILSFARTYFYFCVASSSYYLIIIPLTLTIMALCNIRNLNKFINVYILLNTFIFILLVILTSVTSTVYFTNHKEFKDCKVLANIMFACLIYFYLFILIVLISVFAHFIIHKLVNNEDNIGETLIDREIEQSLNRTNEINKRKVNSLAEYFDKYNFEMKEKININ